MKRVAPLLLVLGTVALARADLAPPPGKKVVPVTTAVMMTEDVPDYAFFETSFSSTPGPPPHGGTSRSVTLHFFAPGTAIRATGDRRSGGALYAVPRSVAEGVPGWKGLAADAAQAQPPKHSAVSTSDENWFALARSVQKGEVPGATSIRFGGSAEVPAADPRTAITENYRIVRTPAGAAFVSSDEVPSGDSRSAEGEPDAAPAVPWWRWAAVGGAGFAAILLGGLWIALRGRK